MDEVFVLKSGKKIKFRTVLVKDGIKVYVRSAVFSKWNDERREQQQEFKNQLKSERDVVSITFHE